MPFSYNIKLQSDRTPGEIASTLQTLLGLQPVADCDVIRLAGSSMDFAFSPQSELGRSILYESCQILTDVSFSCTPHKFANGQSYVLISDVIIACLVLFPGDMAFLANGDTLILLRRGFRVMIEPKDVYWQRLVGERIVAEGFELSFETLPRL